MGVGGTPEARAIPKGEEKERDGGKPPNDLERRRRRPRRRWRADLDRREVAASRAGTDGPPLPPTSVLALSGVGGKQPPVGEGPRGRSFKIRNNIFWLSRSTCHAYPAFEGIGKIARRRKAPVGGAGQRLSDEVCEGRRHVCVLGIGTRGDRGKKASKYMTIAPFKEALSDEHLPADDPCGPYVDTPIDRPFGELLGGHVAELPL